MNSKFTLVFIVGYMLSCFSANAQRAKIIGKPFKFGNLEIAQNDLLDEQYGNTKTFIEAKKKCEELGEGWRLPTMSELDTLFKYKKQIKMRQSTYWSNQEYYFQLNDNVYTYAWGKLFTTGAKNFYHVKEENYVRAVRTINTTM